MTLTAGIHKEISSAVYHQDPAPEPSLSSSLCNVLLQRSPLHAWYEHPRLNPAYKPEHDSILDAGTVAHAVLLEGGTDKLMIVEADDWRTKAAREARDAAWEVGRIPVLAGKMDSINAMVEAARKYVAQSELAGIFDSGDPELTLIWQEGDTWCRARPDWWNSDMGLMVDYKSGATSAEPNAWIRQMLNMGYDVQANWYSRGAGKLANEAPDFVFLVQENEPPYACSLVGMAPALVDLAERKVEFALTLWKNCMATGKWNGYPSRICHAEPPDYAVRSFEELIELGAQG